MLKKLLKKYTTSESIRNISTLASGTLIAQLFATITIPITYRIYDKSDYGTLAQYMSIIGIAGIFSTFQYSQSILLEEKEEDAKNALHFNQMLNVVISLFIGLLILFTSNLIAELFNNEAIEVWLYFVPLSVFLKGQNEVLRIWGNRKKQYKILSLNSILLAVVVPIISISLGYILVGEIYGLFIGFFAGQFIPPMIMLYRLNKLDNIIPKKKSISTLLAVAQKHKELPKYSLPSEFLTNFSGQLPVFFLSRFSTVEVVGLYNLAVRILSLPNQVIASAIGTVFREQAIKAFYKIGNCEALFRKTVKTLIIYSIIPYSVILFFGGDIFAIFFGEKWRMSGNFAQLLILLYFFNFITSSVSYMYYIANKIREDFLLRIPMIISTTLGLYIGLLYSVTAGILAFSIIRSCFYGIVLYRSYIFSKNDSL